MYKFIWARPLAFNRLCQPLRSLFMRTDLQYTLQAADGQMSHMIHVWLICCRSGVNVFVVASRSNRLKIWVTRCAGMKQSGIILRRYLMVLSSVACAAWRLHSCMTSDGLCEVEGTALQFHIWEDDVCCAPCGISKNVCLLLQLWHPLFGLLYYTSSICFSAFPG